MFPKVRFKFDVLMSSIEAPIDDASSPPFDGPILFFVPAGATKLGFLDVPIILVVYPLDDRIVFLPSC